MTRIYDSDSTCSSCHEPGQFGWLYQCTQDHEKLIEEKLSCMDSLDFNFRKGMAVRKGSAEARRDKLSFLQELTPKQMASNILPPLGFDSSLNNDAQRTSVGDSVCQYKICQRCRPVCIDRAFLSLNAVADGEIIPTAAAGFGFESLGGRPVIDKDVIRRINEHHPRTYIGNRRMMEMLDEQIARMITNHNQNQPSRTSLRGSASGPRSARQLPTVKNVAAARQRMREQENALTEAAQGDTETVATTPDQLGNRWSWLAAFQTPEDREGNRSHGQYTQQRARATRIPRPTSPGSRSARRRLANQLLFSTSNITPLEGYPWRLFGDSDNVTSTSISPVDDASNANSVGTENEGNIGGPSSHGLRANHGVAMTEESIEARVPDVVTQV
ncbi:hypothetical protein FBEOM_4934 [Fusarium beomiforme]|uniref:Uncharacterized protein n=1 Tax=Fusarium beomiforme TaxID=44412 RepID=A0A9P5AM15_9HYPO|nr:hypothetical protein FBEOM_4934 [Fusarium beomiforme]